MCLLFSYWLKGLGYSCFDSFVGLLNVSFDISARGFRPEDREMVAEELRNADAVVLTYDCGRPETLEGLTTYWLPELRRLEV